jgi:hypothetical protein
MSKPIYDVFVSYRSTDKKSVLKVAGHLKRARLKYWLDKQQMTGGRAFDDAIDAALAKSSAVAVLVGPGGIGPWQKKEVARAAENACTQLIPVLLPGVRPGARLPLALAGLHRIDLTRGLGKDAVAALIAAIRNKPAKAGKPEERAAPLRRKAERKRAAGTTPAPSMIATGGSVVAGSIVGGIVNTGNGNIVRMGRGSGW